MFLAKVLVQGLIIFGVVVFFIISVVLNKKTKAPEGVEIPEQCQSCTSSTCMISLNKVEEMKKEVLEQLKSECLEEE